MIYDHLKELFVLSENLFICSCWILGDNITFQVCTVRLYPHYLHLKINESATDTPGTHTTPEFKSCVNREACWHCFSLKILGLHFSLDGQKQRWLIALIKTLATTCWLGVFRRLHYPSVISQAPIAWPLLETTDISPGYQCRTEHGSSIASVADPVVFANSCCAVKLSILQFYNG